MLSNDNQTSYWSIPNANLHQGLQLSLHNVTVPFIENHAVNLKTGTLSRAVGPKTIANLPQGFCTATNPLFWRRAVSANGKLVVSNSDTIATWTPDGNALFRRPPYSALIDVPAEIFSKVMIFLQGKEPLHLSNTCRRFSHMASQGSLWELLNQIMLKSQNDPFSPHINALATEQPQRVLAWKRLYSARVQGTEPWKKRVITESVNPKHLDALSNGGFALTSKTRIRLFSANGTEGPTIRYVPGAAQNLYHKIHAFLPNGSVAALEEPNHVKLWSNTRGPRKYLGHGEQT